MSQAQMLAIQVAVGAASVAVGTALVVYLSRTKSSAATALRSVVAALVATTVVGTVAAVSADGPAWLSTAVPSEPIETLAVGLAAAVGVPWLVFALRYTGRGNLSSTPVRIGLVFVAVGTVVAQFVGASADGGEPQSLELAVAALTLLSARGLLFVTTATIVWESIGDAAGPFWQGVGFGSAALLPFLGAELLGGLLPASGLSIGALAVTLYFSDPFSRLPAAGVVGRDRVFDEMSAAVVVADTDGRVRDLNETAETVFGADRAATVGEPLEAVTPSLSTHDTGSFRARTMTDRYLQVSVTNVTDDPGQTVGRLFVCRDVTDRRSRGRRIQLVTQLLADAVHDQMSTVVSAVDGETRPLSERPSSPTADGAPASDTPVVATTADPAETEPRTTVTALATVVNRVRELERALEGGTASERVRLTELLRHTARQCDAETSVTVTTNVSVPGIDAPLVRTAVETLCDAATDPRITVTQPDGEVVITVGGDPPDNHTTGVAAATLARIVADTLGGRVETDSSNGFEQGPDDASHADSVVGPDDDWQVTICVPVRHGTVAVFPPQSEGQLW